VAVRLCRRMNPAMGELPRGLGDVVAATVKGLPVADFRQRRWFGVPVRDHEGPSDRAVGHPVGHQESGLGFENNCLIMLRIML
jgi:hypothetical protein